MQYITLIRVILVRESRVGYSKYRIRRLRWCVFRQMFTGVRLATLSREELKINILLQRAVLDDLEHTLAVLDDRDDATTQSYHGCEVDDDVLSVTTQCYSSRSNRSRSRSASPSNRSPNASPRNRSRSTSPAVAPQLTVTTNE